MAIKEMNNDPRPCGTWPKQYLCDTDADFESLPEAWRCSTSAPRTRTTPWPRRWRSATPSPPIWPWTSTTTPEEAAGRVTDTDIIDREEAVPAWSNERDYSACPVGTPVTHDGQVYGLLQPHNAAFYPDTNPAMLAALWRVKHTTNPDRAKPWVKPTSTSDMYRAVECMIWTDVRGNTATMRAKRDTAYSPEEYAGDWETVERR